MRQLLHGSHYGGKTDLSCRERILFLFLLETPAEWSTISVLVRLFYPDLETFASANILDRMNKTIKVMLQVRSVCLDCAACFRI